MYYKNWFPFNKRTFCLWDEFELLSNLSEGYFIHRLLFRKHLYCPRVIGSPTISVIWPSYRGLCFWDNPYIRRGWKQRTEKLPRDGNLFIRRMVRTHGRVGGRPPGVPGGCPVSLPTPRYLALCHCIHFRFWVKSLKIAPKHSLCYRMGEGVLLLKANKINYIQM